MADWTNRLAPPRLADARITRRIRKFASAGNRVGLAAVERF